MFIEHLFLFLLFVIIRYILVYKEFIMLNKLHIKNIALIDECTINFDRGFNVLSGETGAGKSIIIDALNFLLGARADKTLIKSGEDNAEVEGWFEIDCSNSFFDGLFDITGLPKEDLLVLSRSFNLGGKSECRINGESFPINILKKVGEYLVDVFGQNDHSFLLDTKGHIVFLDLASSKVFDYKQQLATYITSIKNINAQIKELGGEGKDRERNIELVTYQINEIEKANVVDGEEEKLSERKKVLLNSEKILQEANELRDIFDNCNMGSNLKIASNIINSLSKYYDDFQQLSDRLLNAKYELEDVVSEVISKTSDIEYNENELNSIEERLDLIKDLKHKYGKDIISILEYLQNAKQKLDNLLNMGEALAKLNNQKNALLDKVFDVCCNITKERKKCALQLENNIIAELKELGMKNASFKVAFLNNYIREDIEQVATLNGADEVEFMFSANLGEPVKSLNKIISGGEMSRFMLAFKCVINNNSLKTYVFDEIDTGIGGAVGGVVGKKLSNIASKNQVLCVTHLAQIACFSDVSYKIEKFEQNNKTYSKIQPLSMEDKVKEITRMIGVGKVDEFAVLHAKELIKESENFKKEFLTSKK